MQQVADFGLARAGAVYQRHTSRVPVKWTAPEALRFGQFSSASDVWRCVAATHIQTNTHTRIHAYNIDTPKIRKRTTSADGRFFPVSALRFTRS